MSNREYNSFAEFWLYYVAEHRKPACRALHFAGTSLALVLLLAALVLANWWMLLAVPFVGYGLAWTGHFFIEKNRPATFGYPLWSFAGDFKMWILMMAGRMGAEVDRANAAYPD